MSEHQKLGFMKRCVFPLALLLLLAVVFIGVAIPIVFHVKDPIMQINNVKVAEFNHIGNTTLIADVSMKNPKFASFEYSNTTATMYYRGIMVGEARGPPRKAKARHTIRMNTTMNVITLCIVSSAYFKKDLHSGVFTMSRFSRVLGQVKILNLFKQHVVVTTDCITTFSIFSSQKLNKFFQAPNLHQWLMENLKPSRSADHSPHHPLFFSFTRAMQIQPTTIFRLGLLSSNGTLLQLIGRKLTLMVPSPSLAESLPVVVLSVMIRAPLLWLLVPRWVAYQSWNLSFGACD